MTQRANIVNVILPTQVIQQFTKNAANQVIEAGGQTLLTMPSSQVGTLLLEKEKESQNDAATTDRQAESLRNSLKALISGQPVTAAGA